MAKAKVTEKNIKLILQGSMGKAILALAVPVVINSFLQTMYNLTDTYWLGQLGTNELAAINLVSPLQQMMENIIAQTKIWLAMEAASSFFDAPISCAIKTAPATVSPDPKFTTICCSGETRLIAVLIEIGRAHV